VPNKFAIRISDLRKSFGTVNAVDGLSLDVPAGAIFGFLGPNGAGKTTTIQLLLGLLEASGGTGTVLGYECATQGQAIRERTGALLEHHGLYEQLTAEENLEFYARIGQMAAGERRVRIRESLEDMELWDRRHDRVGTWSRGMKQQLALGRALLHRPQLVFLDEPTAGLDVMAANAVRDRLATLVQREGTTVFLTTHNMAEAERLCATVGVVRSGRLLALGSPDSLRSGGARLVEIVGSGFRDDVIDDLLRLPGVLTAVVRENQLEVELSEGHESAPLIQALVAAGVRVEEVRKGQASLEDFFITLMQEESA
jgi:ABC-2 type transport system ATP-binding protein